MSGHAINYMLPAVLVALPSPLMLIGRPWAHTCSPILLVLCQKLEAIIIPIESVMQPDLAPKSSAGQRVAASLGISLPFWMVLLMCLANKAKSVANKNSQTINRANNRFRPCSLANHRLE